MSDIRLVAGLLVFVVGTTSFLVMVGDTFPEAKPTGVDPTTFTAPGENETVQVFEIQDCGPQPDAVNALGHIACHVRNILGMMGNFLAQFFDALARGAQFTLAIILFRIPALSDTGNPVLIMINNLIAVPIWFGVGFFTFRVIRSLIPFIRGS